MNILDALKKYIRANGGSSRANNISEAVRDLDSIPQGSGGGGVVWVNVDFDNSLNAIADKTLEELINNVHAGREVKAKILINGEDSGMVLNFSMLSESLIFGGFVGTNDNEWRPLLACYHDWDEDRDVWESYGILG